MRRLLPAALLLSALLGIGLLVDVATARPASAHATVVTTTPTDGARLAAAPAQVTFPLTVPQPWAEAEDGDVKATVSADKTAATR